MIEDGKLPAERKQKNMGRARKDRWRTSESSLVRACGDGSMKMCFDAEIVVIRFNFVPAAAFECSESAT